MYYQLLCGRHGRLCCQCLRYNIHNQYLRYQKAALGAEDILGRYVPIEDPDVKLLGFDQISFEFL